MNDFHRLRFSSHRRQRLRELSLVPLGWLFGFFGASTAFLPVPGVRFRTHSAAAASESLHSGSFACVRPRQALLDEIISISPIALGNYFRLRRTLKPVFESI
jgi:hypothetical protein